MPPATLEEKVEVLRRIRDRRLEREREQSGTVPVVSNVGEGGFTHEGAAVDEPLSASQPGQRPAASPLPRPDICGPGGAGEADALFCTGHCLERGLHGCPADPGAAAVLYLEAAKHGHSVAQWRLGELCEYGRGVPQSDAEAVRWYRRAAEAGSVPAQVGLALLLEAGRGCEPDDAQAFRWHSEAAEAGDALAQYCAAHCLLEGRGAAPDRQAALGLLRRSADAGFGPAAEDLAEGLAVGSSGGANESLTEDDVDGSSLLNIAGRLAKQLQDIDGADAEVALEDLLQDLLPSVRGAALPEPN